MHTELACTVGMGTVHLCGRLWIKGSGVDSWHTEKGKEWSGVVNKENKYKNNSNYYECRWRKLINRLEGNRSRAAGVKLI